MSQDLTRIFAHFLMDHFDGSFLTDDIAVKKRRIAPFFNGYSGSCWHSIITTPSGSLQLLAWERPTKRWYLRRKKCINYSLFASLNGGCTTVCYFCQKSYLVRSKALKWFLSDKNTLHNYGLWENFRRKICNPQCVATNRDQLAGKVSLKMQCISGSISSG